MLPLPLKMYAYPDSEERWSGHGCSDIRGSTVYTEVGINMLFGSAGDMNGQNGGLNNKLP